MKTIRWDSVRRRIPPALLGPTAKRGYLALFGLLVVFLWLNMVRRALKGSGSQYDDFVLFSQDLLFDRIDVYTTYPEWNTITKYPPFFSFLMAPVAWLPDAIGATVWFWASFAMAAASAWLAGRIACGPDAPPSEVRPVAVAAFVLAAGVIGSNLETAQVNLALLFGTLLGLAWFRGGRDGRAGAMIGVMAAIKLTPGIFLAWFAWKRSWKAVLAGAGAVAACWFVVQPLAFGPGHWATAMRGWVESVVPFLSEGTRAEGVGGFRHTNQSLSAAVHRFLSDVPATSDVDGLRVTVVDLGRETARGLTRALVAFVVLATAWLTRGPADRRASPRLAGEMALVFVAALFISPISWINHYVTLLLPFAVLARHVRVRPEGAFDHALGWWAAAIAFVFLAAGISETALAYSTGFFAGAVVAATLGWMLGRRVLILEPK